MLEDGLFQTVVRHTPLVSIDLLVKNSQGEILLGRRTNRPAQGYWFVPGGRILKDETLAAAFQRLALAELGIERSIGDAVFVGPYEHFYPDNYAGEDFSTHYVVLAFELELEIELEDLPVDQHGDYRWFGCGELLNTDTVHEHTKWYFDGSA